VLASHVLLAVGRRPNTDDLGLDKAGVEIDARGYIAVDDELRTSVPDIFALGDCNGRGAFTHTAYNDSGTRRKPGANGLNAAFPRRLNGR
jgi:pyruvate/2-oxoglutarate dehydrogenase complex dihydrolipoamide dehydrogenase (E3) component